MLTSGDRHVSPGDSTPQVSGPEVLLCRSTLQTLANDTSPQTLLRLLGVFQREVQKRMGAINTAWVANDIPHLQLCVHALKSSARSFGCLALAKACAQLERRCVHETPAQVWPDREPLLALMQASLTALEAFAHEPFD